jgi:flagellar hook-length control protein FliK
MTIGSAVPAIPATGEKVAGAQGECGAGADMFGEIIAGMALATATEAVEGNSAEEQAEPSPSDANAAASVLQLLALTVRQQGKAREQVEPDVADDQPMGECDLLVPTLGEDLPGAVAIATPPSVAAQPQVVSAKPPEPGAATPPASPQVVPMKSNAEPKIPDLAEAIAETEAEEAAPRTVAATQIADLLKAVTKPVTTANASTPAAEPISRNDEPAVPRAAEPRSLLQAAIASAISTNNPSLEAARMLEPLPDAVPVEPAFDASEFAIERQLDMSAEGEWLDGLARDIARTAGEGGTLRFRLNPENLGTLRVEITPQANGSAVRLTADTDAARTIIADAQTRLVAEAKANGVRISETHVDLGGQNPSGDPRRQNAAFEEAPIRTARFLPDQEESDGKPTPSKSERYA